MTPRQIIKLAGAVILGVIAISFMFQTFVTVGADEIVVRQGAINGNLTVWTQPGVQCQCLGRITKYKKSAQFWFSEKDSEGKKADESIKVRFNDGGHAQLSGSLRFDLPLDYGPMTKLHMTYGSHEAVEHELIKQVVTKSVYMTGPLMSSKESNAERRPDLINYIQDQVSHGVYRTLTKQVKVPDPITGQEKTVAIVEISIDPKSYNGLAREEASPIESFGIRTTNVTINSIVYDPDVEAQIKAQQKALMDVQTAQAESKKAEQRALTVVKEGEAEAAKAKWTQEALKAKAVTEAEQTRDVAKLTLEAAEFTKKAQIAEGEGQAEKARLIMTANGALEQKLAAWVDVNKAYAAELGKQRWVPDVQINSAGASNAAGADILNLLQIKTARDLALDLQMKTTKK